MGSKRALCSETGAPFQVSGGLYPKSCCLRFSRACLLCRGLALQVCPSPLLASGSDV